MTRTLISVLAAGLLAAAIAPADAAKRKVEVSDQFDGSWRIVAKTTSGPRAPSTTYQVRIEGSEASIPGDDVDVDGGVSAGGAVRATIIQGANRVPITGSLDAGGSGSGSWQTTGGLVSCSGEWSAKRGG